MLQLKLFILKLIIDVMENREIFIWSYPESLSFDLSVFVLKFQHIGTSPAT